MPWARIPPDKLINLPLFGIDVLFEDEDFIWMRGPSGRMRVRKAMPRVWFETVEDAHQAGAVAIRIATPEDKEAYDAFIATFEEDEGGPEEPLPPAEGQTD